MMRCCIASNIKGESFFWFKKNPDRDDKPFIIDLSPTSLTNKETWYALPIITKENAIKLRDYLTNILEEKDDAPNSR